MHVFILLLNYSMNVSNMLNRCSGSGRSCFISDHKVKAFNISLFSMILAVGLSYMVFLMLRYILLLYSL